MKLICGILILAGVFALNDASITPEEQMRLVQDQMMVESLKRASMNRDTNSLECSKTLLAELTAILDTYNQDMAVCNQTSKDSIDALNKEARTIIEGYGSTMQGTCEVLNDCAAIEAPLDSMSCYEQKTSASARTLTSVSNDAASQKLQLEKNIESVRSTEDLCQLKAYGIYSDNSDKSNTKFSDCVSGKKTEEPASPQEPEQPQEPQEPETPAEPQEPETPQEPQTPEEPQAPQEPAGRRLNKANKFQRF